MSQDGKNAMVLVAENYLRTIRRTKLELIYERHGNKNKPAKYKEIHGKIKEIKAAKENWIRREILISKVKKRLHKLFGQK